MNNLVGALSRFLPQSTEVSSGQSSSASAAGSASAKGGESFLDALKESMSDESSLRFSRHAESRLRDREIELTSTQLSRLERATDKAAEKGAKDALMMLGELSLIVSVNNRTVVTAMQAGEGDDAVYTNIDTAVIVSDSDKETA